VRCKSLSEEPEKGEKSGIYTEESKMLAEERSIIRTQRWKPSWKLIVMPG
jgi:hypothetical protein